MERVWVGNRTYDAVKKEYEGTSLPNGGIDFDVFVEALIRRGLSEIQYDNIHPRERGRDGIRETT